MRLAIGDSGRESGQQPEPRFTPPLKEIKWIYLEKKLKQEVWAAGRGQEDFYYLTNGKHRWNWFGASHLKIRPNSKPTG